jgi:hypothetical protein
MMLQLAPSIPVETPKGKGQAVIIIDYSPEHDFYWVVFMDDSRECWTFSNKDIRAQPNCTIGRGKFPGVEENYFNRSNFQNSTTPPKISSTTA